MWRARESLNEGLRSAHGLIVPSKPRECLDGEHLALLDILPIGIETGLFARDVERALGVRNERCLCSLHELELVADGGTLRCSSVRTPAGTLERAREGGLATVAPPFAVVPGRSAEGSASTETAIMAGASSAIAAAGVAVPALDGAGARSIVSAAVSQGATEVAGALTTLAPGVERIDSNTIQLAAIANKPVASL